MCLNSSCRFMSRSAVRLRVRRVQSAVAGISDPALTFCVPGDMVRGLAGLMVRTWQNTGISVIRAFRGRFKDKGTDARSFALMRCEPGFFVKVSGFSRIYIIIGSSNLREFPVGCGARGVDVRYGVGIYCRLGKGPCSSAIRVVQYLSRIGQRGCVFLRLSVILVRRNSGSRRTVVRAFGVLHAFFGSGGRLSSGRLVKLCTRLCAVYDFRRSLRVRGC